MENDGAAAGGTGELGRIDELMREQDETDFEDMIATNLVKFEYDIFQ